MARHVGEGAAHSAGVLPSRSWVGRRPPPDEPSFDGGEGVRLGRCTGCCCCCCNKATFSRRRGQVGEREGGMGSGVDGGAAGNLAVAAGWGRDHVPALAGALQRAPVQEGVCGCKAGLAILPKSAEL